MEDEDDDVPTCPLCLEELDATDRAVKACHCGYQVCLWCLHTIRERLNRRCPACRTLYEEHNFKFDDVNPEQAAKEAKERKTAKKERERREKLKQFERERARALVLSQQKAKSNLKHARILQRNLVYVIGLSLTLAREEVIRRSDMFGRFGRIIRALVNRSHPFNADAPGGPSISAYVQYARDVDAASAVRSMNNAVYDGREIRCAIATTKYCDTFVRNAQVGDPSTTHPCGNPQCMYYHTTSHSDSVLTREEVLARQLGPPPPAHLFLPPTTRHPLSGQSFPRSANIPPISQPQSQSANRSIPNRPAINVGSTSQPPSSAPIIHPPAGPNHLPASLAYGTSSGPLASSSTAPPSSSSPKGKISSPLISARGSAANLSSSPQRTPPSSPPAIQPDSARRSRSPAHSDTSNPRTSASSLPSMSSSVPWPSSAAWASTQPGHPVSRSPVRRSRAGVGEEVNRTRPVVAPRKKSEAPPGFEDTSFSASPPHVPSRPPGFEAPEHPSASTEEIPSVASGMSVKESTESPRMDTDIVPTQTTSMLNSQALTTSVATSAPMAPPPGFDVASASKKETEESVRDEVAVAWSQEASSDEVFSSAKERRTAAAVGEVRARSSSDLLRDPGQSRASLEKVLSSIGGSLGVSSEIYNLKPPLYVSADPETILLSNREVATSEVESSEVGTRNGIVGAPFRPQAESERDDFYGVENRLPAQSQGLLSGSNRLKPVNVKEEYENTLVHSHPVASGVGVAVPRDLARAAVLVRGMRSSSRFSFAQDEASESVLYEQGHTANMESGISAANVGIENVRSSGTADAMMHPNDVREGIPLYDDYPDVVSVKKSNISGRQTRSRFDFADYGSSPNRNPALSRNVQGSLSASQNEHRHDFSSVPIENGVVPFANREPKSDSGEMRNMARANRIRSTYGGSIHTMPPERKLTSMFSPTDWGTNTMRPISRFGPHVEQVRQQMGSTSSMPGPNVFGQSGIGRNGVNNAMPTGLPEGRRLRRAGNGMNAVNNRGIQSLSNVVGSGAGLPPPGFREATSGISPDSTAGDKTSATSGVATKSVSGGTRNVNHAGENAGRNGGSRFGMSGNLINRGGAAVEDGISSGTESFEDDRKRSRAQRKRDRKARQMKEGADRKIPRDNRDVASGTNGTDNNGGNGRGNVSASGNSGNGPGPRPEGNVVDQVRKATAAVGGSEGSKGKWGGSSGNTREDVKRAPQPNGNMSATEKKEREGKGKRNKNPDRNESQMQDWTELKNESVATSKDDGAKFMSVSELEREVEAARVREAQLQDKLTEITRRLQRYDNVRT